MQPAVHAVTPPGIGTVAPRQLARRATLFPAIFTARRNSRSLFLQCRARQAERRAELFFCVYYMVAVLY
jgi:hypothetical protein